jgi:hypothetical protein
MTSFGGEVKPHVGRFYGMLRNPAEYERDISSAKFPDISRQVSPDLLLGVPGGICQRVVVYGSGIIRTQMGTHSRSENGCSVWDALYDTTPNSNQ